jgi:hypothetical protein
MMGNETIFMEGGRGCQMVIADQETHVVNPSTHPSIRLTLHHHIYMEHLHSQSSLALKRETMI